MSPSQVHGSNSLIQNCFFPPYFIKKSISIFLKRYNFSPATSTGSFA